MPSPNLLRVGNDVVDLTHVRTRDKSSDERFLARVFTDSERAGIRRARDPDLDVWCRWDAKEAAGRSCSRMWGLSTTGGCLGVQTPPSWSAV